MRFLMPVVISLGLIAGAAAFAFSPVHAEVEAKRSPGAAQDSGAIEDGTALQGTNLTYYAQPNFAQCQADCANNTQCRGFTWIRAGTYNPGDPAMCYLMATVTGRSPARGHVSVVSRGGARSRLPGTTTAGPLGGRRNTTVGGTDTPGWGVWASASGGRWNDPCAIQYNAARLAGNRYDGNPGYRRVRTRDTQREADLDIDHFGRYHRDQPDGVAKMTSCASAGNAAPANIAGTWRGYRGLSYSIRQSDNKFSWSQADMQETGQGTINGNTISASWSGNNGSNSATGRIITSGNGYATRIEWSNGVVFTR